MAMNGYTPTKYCLSPEQEIEQHEQQIKRLKRAVKEQKAHERQQKRYAERREAALDTLADIAGAGNNYEVRIHAAQTLLGY